MASHTLSRQFLRSSTRVRRSLHQPPLAWRPKASRRTPRKNASSSSTSTSSSPSSSSAAPPPPPDPSQAAILGPGLRLFLYSTAAAATAYGTYLYATDTRASLLHRYLVPRLIRALVPDAEAAHHLGTSALETTYNLGLHVRDRTSDAGLGVRVFGTWLDNPIGISAGLDKDARVPDPLFALGAAVVEVGGITPLPQDGNPTPRVFRVAGLQGLVNRYGLNSQGADAVARRLRARLWTFARAAGLTEGEVLNGGAGVPPGSLKSGRLLCVQVAKQKGTDETDTAAVAADYEACVLALGPYADVLVVNVSSPNTPGLRDLQATGPLTEILATTVRAAEVSARRAGRREPARVMVKVSPDEDADSQVDGVVRAVWRSGVDGVIVGNTTKRRDVVPAGAAATQLSVRDLAALHETGGYSGPAMFDRTLALVGRYRKVLDEHGFAQSSAAKADGAETTADEKTARPAQSSGGDDQKVIFATGGITNGAQALAVLNAGASVAMVYTGMVYGGAGTVTRMKSEIKQLAAAAATGPSEVARVKSEVVGDAGAVARLDAEGDGEIVAAK